MVRQGNDLTEEHITKAYSHGYKVARIGAFKRSKSQCQFCGCARAVETHHWALIYPSGDQVTSDDLTALCSQCHQIAKGQRDFYKSGKDRWTLIRIFHEAIRNALQIHD